MAQAPLTVIVGAAQGIGAQVARTLARSGPVVLADIQQDAAAELAAELRAGGAEARARRVDVTDPASVAALVAAEAETTRLAIVAGAFCAGPSRELESAQFMRILSVNLVGAYDVARQFSEAMIQNGGGSIVAIGSIAARMPRLRQAAYSASKAGMRQALRVLGLEVREHGVRINFVAPGPTQSPMMAELAADHTGIQLWEGELETWRPRIPDGRVATPDDVANAIEFLLSDKAAHIALHDLYVDGGESLGM
ncbi:SDR family oxidoreductase [Microbacterium sp. STN6]|uniref:SDR family oxidoreductase n=1 Tax=Microbacterium sp. STN6 TaxID=2995588 RepID=UPI002260FB10|nr:SDR family oxidoreductase [Microbacterium sp. STN6]MCX7522546.1 SDR family oxidoreductase [Microbacterium sp. STN6]